jgi:nucleoside-diphosphate-sugar epimerase
LGNSEITVWVTGGTGFIGSAFIQNVLEISGYKVNLLARKAADITQIKRKFNNHPNLQITLTENGYQGLFSASDIVVHIAGVQSAPDLDDATYYSINYGMTKELLNACPSNLGLFLFMSSIKVYGDYDFERINENTPYKGKSRYADSKAKAEQLVAQIAESRNFNSCIVQPVFVYGKGDTNGYLSKINSFVKKGISLKLNDGKNRLSFIHISDLCQIMVRCIQNIEGVNGKTFIAAYPEVVTLNQVYKGLEKIKNKKTIPIRLPRLIQKLLVRFGLLNSNQIFTFTQNLVVDPQKVYSELAFQPNIDLEKGLNITFK